MSLLASLAVRSVRRLSRSFVRIEFAGPDLAEFGIDGPCNDQRIKLIFPGPTGALPTLSPDSWWSDYRGLPEAERGSMRTYTIRSVRVRGADSVIAVDFVIHGDPPGPASRWADRAEPGQRVLGVLPRRGSAGGIEWAPPDRGRLLLVGDESAVPAACSIIETLPRDADGAAFLEVPDAGDIQPLDGPPGVIVHWLPRHGAAVGELITRAVGGHLGLTVGHTAPRETIDPALWETPTFSSSGESVGTPGTDGAGTESQGFTTASAGGESASHATASSRPSPPGAGTEMGYAWIAGEAGMVTSLRRALVRNGVPRERVAFMGYWRIGATMHA